MELNRIATGIKLVGTTIKEISVENNIVNVQKEAKEVLVLILMSLVLKILTKAFFANGYRF